MIKSVLVDTYKESNALEYLKNVIDIIKKNSKKLNINPRIFHSYTSILYDIRTLLNQHLNIKHAVYLEIGSMHGASAGLMLQHPCNTEVICIDPCIGLLDPKRINY